MVHFLVDEGVAFLLDSPFCSGVPRNMIKSVLGKKLKAMCLKGPSMLEHLEGCLLPGRF